jgi:hypothetical protein
MILEKQKDFIEQFVDTDKKTVKFITHRYDQVHGKKSLVHLLIDFCSRASEMKHADIPEGEEISALAIVEYLKSCNSDGISLERRNLDGDTPLLYLFKQSAKFEVKSSDAAKGKTHSDIFESLFNFLVTYNANSNALDKDESHSGIAAIIHHRNLDYFLKLHAAGCRINYSNISDQTPLSLAISYQNLEFIETLVQNGAAVNFLDRNGRNSMHNALLFSSKGSDISFEIENYLMSSGVNLLTIDHLNRSLLHYCFLQGQLFPGANEIDPIEKLNSVLENCPSIDQNFINKKDIFGNTALHYAARVGANICTLVL